jgi:methylthioribose-1-phosphate isomerase
MREPTESGAGAVDLGRRKFFRQFATEVFHTAATVVGAATALQRSSAEAASAILNPDAGLLPPVSEADEGPPAPASPKGGPVPAAALSAAPPPPPRPGARPVIHDPRGFRTAFRVDEDILVLVDQRRLPHELAEVEVRSAVELAHELREGTMARGPAAGQAAAVALSLTASRVHSARPYGRRAILRAGASQLQGARPTSRPIAAAVARLMVHEEPPGSTEVPTDGGAVADAIRAETDRILLEAMADQGQIGRVGIELLPSVEGRPIGILVHGAIGALAGGQVGTAMAVIRNAVDAERDVLIHVAETRPSLVGARVTAWELAQAEVPHVVVADAAAGWLMEAGRIDVVLVTAESIATNGDVAAEIGTYPLAVLAQRHRLPFVVCAPLVTVDPAAANGAALAVEQGPATGLTRVGSTSVAPAETAVLNPACDVTPHDLVTAIVTEEGVLRAPLGSAIADALERRTSRHERLTDARATLVRIEPGPG